MIIIHSLSIATPALLRLAVGFKPRDQYYQGFLFRFSAHGKIGNFIIHLHQGIKNKTVIHIGPIRDH